MKKVLTVVLAVVLLATTGGVALADKPPEGYDSLGNPIFGGNGAPSGQHYTLNLIGKDKTMPQDECDSGNRIFVKLDRQQRVKTKIMLVDSESPGVYEVRDCNGTDGVAEFALPNPDEDGDGVTAYSVFFRLRGKPGGDVRMTTCAYDPVIEEIVCSDLQIIEVRETGHGKNKFNNVSAELLYIYAWIWDGEEWVYTRVNIFDPRLEGYFWDYDNNRVRLAQLRFYEIPTTVPDAEDIPHLVSIVPDYGTQCDDGLAVTIEGSTSTPIGDDVDFTGYKSITFSNPGVSATGAVGASDNILNLTVDVDCAAEPGMGYVTIELADKRELSIHFEVIDDGI